MSDTGYEVIIYRPKGRGYAQDVEAGRLTVENGMVKTGTEGFGHLVGISMSALHERIEKMKLKLGVQEPEGEPF